MSQLHNSTRQQNKKKKLHFSNLTDYIWALLFTCVRCIKLLILFSLIPQKYLQRERKNCKKVVSVKHNATTISQNVFRKKIETTA